MRRFGLIALAILVVVSVAVAFYKEPARHTRDQPAEPTASYLAINEWRVKVPTANFDAALPKGYLIAPMPDTPTMEGLIWLDQPLAKITESLGMATIERAKKCLNFYHGIYRQPNAQPNGIQSTGTDLAGAYSYEPMTPSASCATSPKDHTLDKFNNHVLSNVDANAVIKALQSQ